MHDDRCSRQIGAEAQRRKTGNLTNKLAGKPNIPAGGEEERAANETQVGRGGSDGQSEPRNF